MVQDLLKMPADIFLDTWAYDIFINEFEAEVYEIMKESKP